MTGGGAAAGFRAAPAAARVSGFAGAAAFDVAEPGFAGALAPGFLAVGEDLDADCAVVVDFGGDDLPADFPFSDAAAFLVVVADDLARLGDFSAVEAFFPDDGLLVDAALLLLLCAAAGVSGSIMMESRIGTI